MDKQERMEQEAAQRAAQERAQAQVQVEDLQAVIASLKLKERTLQSKIDLAIAGHNPSDAYGQNYGLGQRDKDAGQLTALRAQRTDAEGKRRFLLDKLNTGEATEILALYDPLLQQLTEARSKLPEPLRASCVALKALLEGLEKLHTAETELSHVEKNLRRLRRQLLGLGVPCDDPFLNLGLLPSFKEIRKYGAAALGATSNHGRDSRTVQERFPAAFETVVASEVEAAVVAVDPKAVTLASAALPMQEEELLTETAEEELLTPELAPA